MRILKHVLFAVIPSLIIGYFNVLGGIVFFIASVFIDIDHYPVYVLKFRNLNVRKAIKYFSGLKECRDVALLHAPELMFLILVASYFFRILFFVFLGFAFHLGLDIYDARKNHIIRYFSFIKWFKNEIIK